MIAPHLKSLAKIALVTALAITAYEASNLLLIYKYFRFEYYLLVAVLIALIIGFLIAKQSNRESTINADVQLTDKLTQREMEILLLIANGKTNKEIATLNFVEISTVKTHINNIYSKLDVGNRSEAAKVYHNWLTRQKSTLSPPVTV